MVNGIITRLLDDPGKMTLVRARRDSFGWQGTERIVGRCWYSENLTTCLLCISEAIQSQCTLLAVPGGGRSEIQVMLRSMPGVWVT